MNRRDAEILNHQDTKAQREPVSLKAEMAAKATVDAAYSIHSKLGPGLLESVYEICLAHEMEKRKFKIARQVSLPVYSAC